MMDDHGMEMGGTSPALSYEGQLLQRVKAGERNAREELFGHLQQPAYRVARFHQGNEADGDDGVQTGLLKTFVRLDSFGGCAPFKTWALHIVRNAARDLRRKRWRHQRPGIDPMQVRRRAKTVPGLRHARIP